MLRELLSKFRKPKEPEVDEEALEDEKERQELKELMETYHLERAQRLETICQHLRLSKKELIEKLNVTEKIINDFESDPTNRCQGLHTTTTQLLYKLVTQLKVNPVFLIGGTGNMFLQEEEVRYIANFDFGDDNAAVLEYLTYIKLSPELRRLELAQFKRDAWLGYTFFVREIQKTVSKMEEKND